MAFVGLSHVAMYSWSTTGTPASNLRMVCKGFEAISGKSLRYAAQHPKGRIRPLRPAGSGEHDREALLRIPRDGFFL
jgi:hypothetical protein